jgi:plastocyanin
MRVSVTITALIMSVIPVRAGDVSGQVVITKRLTKRTLAPIVYNLRGATPSAAAADAISVNEFERTVVILDKANLPAPTPVTAIVSQRNSRFEPDLVVIPVGSTVQFPNFDPIFHNVFSLSSAQPFDLGFYAKSQSRSVKFSRPGIVQVYCHIHSQMYAGIVVTDSPYSAKPAADGRFFFANVPAGLYRLAAWHKVAGRYQVEIDVPETGTAVVKISVPVDAEQLP